MSSASYILTKEFRLRKKSFLVLLYQENSLQACGGSAGRSLHSIQAGVCVFQAPKTIANWKLELAGWLGSVADSKLYRMKLRVVS